MGHIDVTTEYITALTRAYPEIRKVWLIGSRADGTAKPSSDWDYIAIADAPTLKALSTDAAFNDPTIDLLVVYDGDCFCKPWPDGDRVKQGSLDGWQWRAGDNQATYKATKPPENGNFSATKVGKARLVYPNGAAA